MTGLLAKQEKEQMQFHFVEGAKFKTNIIVILMRTALTRENVTKTALLAEVLKNGCKAYPSRQAVAKKTDEMSGAVFDISLLKKGEEQILFFYLEVLKYDETLLQQGFSFLKEYITHPLIENKAFPKEMVEREKKILARKIRAGKDDKKAYAKQRCLEEMFRGEPFGLNADGYEEDLDLIDGETLYLHYYSILKHAPMEVMLCGEKEQREVGKELTRKLGFSGQLVWEFPAQKIRKNQKTCNVVEKAQVSQGRLCIGYFSDIAPSSKEFPVLLLTSEVLGGGASSLLFENVREKEGLCYYVNSLVIRMKSVMLIQTGIAAENYEKTVKMITNIISEMAEKEIDVQRLEFARESLIRYFASLEDSPTAQMDFFTNQYLLQSSMTIGDFIKKLKRISPEEISKVVKGLQLGAVYFLQSEEGEENGNKDGK